MLFPATFFIRKTYLILDIRWLNRKKLCLKTVEWEKKRNTWKYDIHTFANITVFFCICLYFLQVWFFFMGWAGSGDETCDTQSPDWTFSFCNSLYDYSFCSGKPRPVQISNRCLGPVYNHCLSRNMEMLVTFVI